jgi:hypothetical protein
MAMQNNSIEILTSQARTATPAVIDFRNPHARGIQVILDVTVNAGGLGSITLSIYGRDKLSGKRYLLLASVAVTAAATTRYTVFPGAPVAANVSANDQLPSDVEIEVVHGNANPITYSVGAQLLA